MNTILLSAAASKGLDISIAPEYLDINGFAISRSSISGTLLVLILVAILWWINRQIPKFEDVPTGLQNLVELLVESMYKFAHGKVGHAADFVAPYIMALMAYIMFGTLIELFGLPAITGDLSTTLALGVMSFVMTNVVAFKTLGLKGRFKNWRARWPLPFPLS